MVGIIDLHLNIPRSTTRNLKRILNILCRRMIRIPSLCRLLRKRLRRIRPRDRVCWYNIAPYTRRRIRCTIRQGELLRGAETDRIGIDIEERSQLRLYIRREVIFSLKRCCRRIRCDIIRVYRILTSPRLIRDNQPRMISLKRSSRVNSRHRGVCNL